MTHFSHRIENDICIVSLHNGYLDADEMENCVTYLTPLIEKPSIFCLLMNWEEVDSMEVFVIEMLLRLKQKLKKIRVELCLCQVGEHHQEAFDTLPSQSLSVFPTEKEALMFLRA